jgi:hypothetical protein
MNAQTPEIALRPFPVGERNYAPGDKFEAKRHLDQKDLEEKHVGWLRSQGKIAPITRETYAHAMAHHQPGHMGRGFTKAYLIEMGILDAPEPDLAPAEASAEEKPDTVPGLIGVHEVNGRLLREVKIGPRTYFEPVTVEGELLRSKRFQAKDKATEFLEAMPPIVSTDAPGSDTPGQAPSEAPDGEHLQP